MYSEKFVVSLKVDNKYLRDSYGVVKLPFGSEFSLYLKNMESKNAVVKVSIDGNDVLDGNRLIVRANSSLELEGFMKNEKVRNKFKFIEMTKEIEEVRGNKPEDSLIRVEFWYEKPKVEYVPYYYVYTQPQEWKWNEPNVTWTYTVNDNTSSSRSMENSKSMSNSIMNVSTNDAGITVGGSHSDQKFNYGYVGNLENESHVLILKLSGYHDSKKVETLVGSRDKIVCSICGTRNSNDSRYCKICGNSLF